MARPSDYTPELGLAICELIADGESLRSICKAEDKPGKSTVLRWLLEEDKKDFRDQYARARELQAESHVDDIIDIADDGSNDWMEKKNADGAVIGWQENGEHLQRSKLRIEARKWKASKLAAKKYGDKLALTDPDGGALTVNVVQRAYRPSA